MRPCTVNWAVANQNRNSSGTITVCRQGVKRWGGKEIEKRRKDEGYKDER
jgi:hypothetical protein